MAATLTHSRFDRRACLVTGASRGIGRAIAIALGHEGANVGVFARSRGDCENVVQEIGVNALALVGDVSDAYDRDVALADFVDRFGPPSVVVNAAGVSPVRQRAEAHDVEAFRTILEVNLLGSYCMTRAAAPFLLADGGAVVNVASILGSLASPRLVGYGASKAGVIQMTRTLAREWADRGVRVNAVCPGYLETDLTRAMLEVDHIRKEIIDGIPMRRLASFDEIVAPVLFLASNESSYITGTSLIVDGGMAA
jgi:NAD(P)-dependent dehydrogenase (short-subunit alcohol dehydrogenase family)